MPYSTSNKQIQDSAFKLKSGNTSPFKQMGASPLKGKPGGSVGEAVDHWAAYNKKKKVLDASQKYYKSMSVTDVGLKKSKEITSKYIDQAVKRGSDYEWKIRSARNQKFVEHAKTKLATQKTSVTSKVLNTLGKVGRVVNKALLPLTIASTIYDFGKTSIKRKKAGKSGFNFPKPTTPKKGKGFNF